jgi:RNA polymerase sigma factor (sigma-70 family)
MRSVKNEFPIPSTLKILRKARPKKRKIKKSNDANIDIKTILATRIFVPEGYRGLPLSNMQFSVRLKNALIHKKLKLIGDLHNVPYSEFLLIPNLGCKSLRELHSFIELIQNKDPTFMTSEIKSIKCILPPVKKIDIPRNARTLNLNEVPISRRLKNILYNKGFQLLGDIHNIPYEDLYKEKNCGHKTMLELEKFIYSIQETDFNQLEIQSEKFAASAIMKQIDKFLEKLYPREKDILVLRIGGSNIKPPTLEEIGRRYGLTRERVRQIEDKIKNKLRKSVRLQCSRLINVLASKSEQSAYPLTPNRLEKLAAADNSSYLRSYTFYSRLLSEIAPEIPFWIEEGKSYVHKSQQKKIEGEIRELIRDGISTITFKEAFIFLKQKSGWKRLKFTDLINALKYSKSFLFDFSEPDCPRIRLAHIKTQDIARVILNNSDRPLTPEQIIESAKNTLGDEISMPSSFSLANVLKPEDGFYLLDRRSFGLRKHFRLGEDSWKRVRSDFYKLLKAERRPISTTEIVSQSKFDWANITNAYEIGQIIREDPRFIDLGRFLFALFDWGIEERQHVHELVPVVLGKAMRPMNATDISKDLQRFRSITPSSISSILRKHPEVQDYGFGYYGLKSWGSSKSEFLVSESLLIDRIIRRSEPPLKFSQLCDKIGIPREGRLSDNLWITARSLKNVRFYPDYKAPDTELAHRSWSLEQAIYKILEISDKAIPAYEIKWELEAKFGLAFRERKITDIVCCLNRSRLFIQNQSREYLLIERIDVYDFDIENIKKAVYEILADNNEIIGCDDLLERIETNGIEMKNLSPSMLGTILRDDEMFEEIGNNFFRIRQWKP